MSLPRCPLGRLSACGSAEHLWHVVLGSCSLTVVKVHLAESDPVVMVGEIDSYVRGETRSKEL